MAGAIAAGLEPAEARWIGEEASGCEGADWVRELDQPSTVRTQRSFDEMVERRLAGEPLQYVLGHWAFRDLDLLVDRRVLIPRPETEWVVEAALALVPADRAPTVVDLGTGSGAIALSFARALWPRVRVVATDVSPAALAVARANVAGLGRPGTKVELHEGDWFDALPPELEGEVDLLVSNPPYVAPTDELPPEVADWEPAGALVPGPTGLEALGTVLAGAATWLRAGGWVVCE
ncbi:MAG: peptide chain release factor N(5)-glutamine methyltransferase, partial [Acidimicrobiia bacterium]|nr:peptide chain release factor N(5)-glutamine methyltransferase [Acidimicrobiia bacterium]